MFLILAITLISDPRLKSPDGGFPKETAKQSISRRVNMFERELGRVRPEPAPKEPAKIYDALTIEEKHLLAAYYDRAIEDGLSDISAKARAAREFRKFRDVDVNAKMVAEAIYESSKAQIADGQKFERDKQASIQANAQARQNRQQAMQTAALQRNAGLIENVRDGETGKKIVRWVSRIFPNHKMANMVWWYETDDAGLLQSPIKVALDYPIQSLATPHDDDRTTSIEMFGEAKDYQNDRQMIRLDGKMWDRVFFEPRLSAIASWIEEGGPAIRFGKGIIYSTPELRAVAEQFLEDYKQRLDKSVTEEFGELHFGVHDNGDGTSRVSWRPRLKKGEDRFLVVWYDRDVKGKPTKDINIAIEYYPAIGEMHERTKTGVSYWTANEENIEGRIPLKTSKGTIVRSGTEFQQITTMVPPTFLSLWAMASKTGENSKLSLSGMDVPLDPWMRPEIREFLIQFKKDADAHQVTHDIKEKTLEYLHD